MEAPLEDAPVFLDRSSRATRGKRMTKLLDDEVEQDEVFWSQEALKDEENDDNYEEEHEIADEFDSDFDEDEPELDEEVADDGEDRVRVKKRLIYPGKSMPKKKKQKQKVISKLKEEAAKEDKSPEQSEQQQDVPEDVEVERTVRKSTRTSVIVRQAERDAIRAALQATAKPIIKRKKEGEEKRMSQEEMLLEAAQTEIMNLRNLERVLAREEEVKKRAIVHKAVYSGPQIRYISKDGCSYLQFSKGASFQSEIGKAPSQYPEKAICAVTGLPAKYRDPKTGLPYATREAFKTLRERYSNEMNGIPKEMDMGTLRDSLSGKGFLEKRRRSEPVDKRETSYLRYFARFRRISSPDEDESSE